MRSLLSQCDRLTQPSQTKGRVPQRDVSADGRNLDCRPIDTTNLFLEEGETEADLTRLPYGRMPKSTASQAGLSS
jgi:hypothetical protein